MNNKKKISQILYDIFFKYQALFFILIILDQITKLIAIKYLQTPIYIFGNWLSLSVTQNSGVAFGGLQNLPQWVATVAIEYYLVIKKPKDKIMVIILVILAAGALGNGIDRWAAVFGRTFLVDGEQVSGVVDFIDVSWFANFNVADIYVTLACVAMVVYMIFGKDDSEPTMKELNEAKKELEKQQEDNIQENTNLETENKENE